MSRASFLIFMPFGVQRWCLCLKIYKWSPGLLQRFWPIFWWSVGQFVFLLIASGTTRCANCGHLTGTVAVVFLGWYWIWLISAGGGHHSRLTTHNGQNSHDGHMSHMAVIWHLFCSNTWTWGGQCFNSITSTSLYYTLYSFLWIHVSMSIFTFNILITIILTFVGLWWVDWRWEYEQLTNYKSSGMIQIQIHWSSKPIEIEHHMPICHTPNISMTVTYCKAMKW